MKSIRKVIIFLVFFMLGFYISALTCHKKNPIKKLQYSCKSEYREREDTTENESRIYKENGQWVPLYRYYERKRYIQIIRTTKLASDISYVILKGYFGKEFFKSHKEFDLYSINNELWAVFDSQTDKLLLLFQKKDCKMLHIANL